MSKQKFTKVNLAIGTPTLNLPSAPAARDPNVVYDARGFPARDQYDDRRGGGYDRGGFDRGGDRSSGFGNRDMAPRGRDSDGPFGGGGGGDGGGAGDNDDNWRRGPSSSSAMAAAPSRMGLRNDVPLRSSTASPMGGSSIGAADTASDWRSASHRHSVDSADDAGIQRGPKPADMSGDWRANAEHHHAAAPASRDLPVHEADLVDNWRAAPKPDLPPALAASAAAAAAVAPAQPVVHEADVVSDWRSVKAAVPEAPPAPRAPPAVRPADAAEDWRAVKAELPPVHVVPSVRRIEQPEGDWRAARGKRLPDGAHVSTPFGAGVLKQTRASDGVLVVSLVFGATAYMRAADVKPTHSQVIKGNVTTPYGKGVLHAVRHVDLIFIVDLPFGVAYLRAEDVADVAGNRRFGDSERDRERESVFSRSFARGSQQQPPPPPRVLPLHSNGAAAAASSSSSGEPAFNPFNQPPRQPRSTAPPPRAFPAAFGADTRAAPRTDDKRAPVPLPAAPQPERVFPAVFTSQPRGPSRLAAMEQQSMARPTRGTAEPPPPSRRPEMPAAFGEQRPRATPQAFATSERPSFAPQSQPLTGSRPPLGGTGRGLAALERGDAPPELSKQAAATSAQQNKRAAGATAAAAAGTTTTTTTAMAAEQAKKVDPNMVAAGIKTLVKEYYLGEDKAGAVKAVKALHVPPEVQPALVAAAAMDLTSVKTRKLVFALLFELHKNKLLESGALLQGLSEVKDVDNARLLLHMLEEKIDGLAAVNAPAGLRAGKAEQQSASDDAGTVAKTVVAMQLGGAALVDKAKEKAWLSVPNLGPALLAEVLSKAASDASCAWLDKAAYGPLLTTLLYKASAKEQMAALNAVQVAFDAVDFPKGPTGAAVIDTVFTKLFAGEVLPDKAFLKWHDDHDSTVAGRTKAVIQTTRFFNMLEAEDDDDDDEDEDD